MKDSTNTQDSKRLRETVRILERKLGVLGDTQMSCCGVTMTQCHALVEIGRVGSISLNELADLLNLENSTMSRTVNNLVNSDIAKRDTDPHDRRYVTIALTENGTEIFKGIEDRMDTYFDDVLNKIPTEKKEQVIESLTILLEALGKNDCCNG